VQMIFSPSSSPLPMMTLRLPSISRISSTGRPPRQAGRPSWADEPQKAARSAGAPG
jgi:hypothetical protein